MKVIRQGGNVRIGGDGASGSELTLQQELERQQADGILVPDVTVKGKNAGELEVNQDGEIVSKVTGANVSLEITKSRTQTNINQMAEQVKFMQGKLDGINANTKLRPEVRATEAARVQRSIDTIKASMLFEFEQGKARGEQMFKDQSGLTRTGAAGLLAKADAQAQSGLRIKTTRLHGGGVRAEAGGETLEQRAENWLDSQDDND